MKIVDSNPRWRSEDIVDLDLEISVRNTPMSRDDPNTIDAIAAILAMDMADEVEEFPLSKIGINRQKKYLKAEVSHLSLSLPAVCHMMFPRCINIILTTFCLSLPYRVPQSKNRGATEKTNPTAVDQQQQHSKYRNLNHIQPRSSTILDYCLEKSFRLRQRGEDCSCQSIDNH